MGFVGHAFTVGTVVDWSDGAAHALSINACAWTGLVAILPRV